MLLDPVRRENYSRPARSPKLRPSAKACGIAAWLLWSRSQNFSCLTYSFDSTENLLLPLCRFDRRPVDTGYAEARTWAISRATREAISPYRPWIASKTSALRCGSDHGRSGYQGRNASPYEVAMVGQAEIDMRFDSW